MALLRTRLTVKWNKVKGVPLLGILRSIGVEDIDWNYENLRGGDHNFYVTRLPDALLEGDSGKSRVDNDGRCKD